MRLPARCGSTPSCDGFSIENGRYNPSLELAWKLSRALGTTIEDLFHFPEGD